MPWSSRDSFEKTKKANTKSKKKKWAKVANAVLEKEGDEGMAIRIANASMNKKKK